VGKDEEIVTGAVAEGTHDALGGGDGYRFEFKQVDLEHPGVLTGEAFDVSDRRFEVVAGKAHGGYVLDQPVVGVIAELGEKGSKGVSRGEELNILASEFVVFFEHAATSKLLELAHRDATLSLWSGLVNRRSLVIPISRPEILRCAQD